VEKQMERRLAGETEVLGENLPQRHFCPSQNPTWPDPGLNQSLYLLSVSVETTKRFTTLRKTKRH
jgi:hypothetical protein